MTDDEKKEMRREVALVGAKLDILRNYQIVADNGIRQQQSVANDEIISVFKDINNQLSRVIRLLEK